MLATKVIHGFTNMSCSGRCTRANGDSISGCRRAITRRPTNKIRVGSAQECKALIVPCLQSQLCLALALQVLFLTSLSPPGLHTEWGMEPVERCGALTEAVSYFHISQRCGVERYRKHIAILGYRNVTT